MSFASSDCGYGLQRPSRSLGIREADIGFAILAADVAGYSRLMGADNADNKGE